MLMYDNNLFTLETFFATIGTTTTSFQLNGIILITILIRFYTPPLPHTTYKHIVYNIEINFSFTPKFFIKFRFISMFPIVFEKHENFCRHHFSNTYTLRVATLSYFGYTNVMPTHDKASPYTHCIHYKLLQCTTTVYLKKLIYHPFLLS
jgi:hypothetical protein